MNPRPLTEIILENNLFVRLGVLRRRWLFPILVRMSLPEPVNLKRLAVALCVFSLYFPDLGLRGTVRLLSIKFRGYKLPRGF